MPRVVLVVDKCDLVTSEGNQQEVGDNESNSQHQQEACPAPPYRS